MVTSVKCHFLFWPFFFIILFSCNRHTSIHPISSSVNLYSYDLGGTNAYVLSNKEAHILIDCGKPGDSTKLLKRLKKDSIDPQNIQYLILTHGHHDHAGNAAFLKSKFSLPVVAGKGDSLMLLNGINDTLCPTSGYANLLYKLMPKPSFEGIQADLYLNGLHTLHMTPNWTVHIWPLSGHTPGSLIIHSGAGLFVGDLIRGQALNRKNPAQHYFLCDQEENINQIQSLLNHIDLPFWFPGHFGPLSKNRIEKRVLDFNKD